MSDWDLMKANQIRQEMVKEHGKVDYRDYIEALTDYHRAQHIAISRMRGELLAFNTRKANHGTN